MKSQYDYEIIRDYLHGVADSKTSREVGELIRRDEIARSIAEGILRLDKKFEDNDEKIEAYLDQFYQSQLNTIQKHATPVRSIQKLWFGIAASILILVTAGFTAWMLIDQPDTDALIAQELSEPYPASNLFRSEGNPTIEDRAYQSYSSGKYAEAAEYFSEIAGETKDIASAIFYHGMSHLYTGNYSGAVELFKSVVISESRYAEQARWYRSISLLRMENKTEAIEVLKEIRKNPRHFKYEPAGELLSQLQ